MLKKDYQGIEKSYEHQGFALPPVIKLKANLQRLHDLKKNISKMQIEELVEKANKLDLGIEEGDSIDSDLSDSETFYQFAGENRYKLGKLDP